MSFYRSKGFWIAFTIISPLLLIVANYGFKVMTSVYKTDLGNGVVIYADDYVKAGRWVFHCGRSRLVSREPLSAPVAELEYAAKLTIGHMYTLSAADEKLAKVAIRAITAMPYWYKSLNYRYSVLGENSDLSSHVFGLLAKHDGQQWALRVLQNIDYGGESSFDITAEPYDPKNYVDYAKALQAAAKSCPGPQ
ncbi:hypothetical protein SAMN05660489_05687 [Pseudomonas sp. LAMO17WK12:I10]|uniref:hypothetical protein n=1 Tax=unclassified Pseudomonas TaxID=196821 RepID=UPI000BD81148|nr:MULTISPECIES: hypothetical protein [unclassified Pseudomonas]PXX54855.1 hypothetical protein H160_05681 [Pseudomonas sp. LAMO17WK12:I9]SNY51392.1 hypothetical protein SAMN05660489_05687 [Pseudomonas sp. LAMO17WK12:I10]